MNSDDLMASIKENLNGNPGQPMLFGVCKTLAKRCGHEAWPYRLGAIVAAVFWTLPTIAIYCLLGLVLPETKDRTHGVFKGLFIMLQEWVEKGLEYLQDLFNPGSRGNSTR